MITVIKDFGDILLLSNGMKIMREDLNFYLGLEEDK